MKLLSLFRSRHLKPEWTYDAKGTIWRILFTERGGIVGECRDQEKRSASFFCLDEESGKPRWQELRLEDPWWVGMESVLDTTLLLHTYAKPDMPAHKGIRAYDTETGTLRWRNDDVTFWFGYGDRVFAYRDFFEKRVGYEIDLQTGEVRATYDQSLQDLHSLRSQALESQPSQKIVLPEILDLDAADPLILSIVKKAIMVKAVAGNVEFILDRDFLSFNFHVRERNVPTEAPLYENHFFAYSFPEGRRVYSGVIGRNLRASVPDSFFIRPPILFFIQDQQVLTALRLWKS